MAYLFDLCYMGVVASLQLLCNLGVTYSRYQMLFRDDPGWKKYIVGAYIFFILLCSWIPFYTVMPIFTNVNAPYYGWLANGLYACIYFPGVILYNMYFTGSFVLKIRRLLTDDITDGRLLLIAKKSVIHSIFR